MIKYFQICFKFLELDGYKMMTAKLYFIKSNEIKSKIITTWEVVVIIMNRYSEIMTPLTEYGLLYLYLSLIDTNW